MGCTCPILGNQGLMSSPEGPGQLHLRGLLTMEAELKREQPSCVKVDKAREQFYVVSSYREATGALTTWTRPIC